MPTELTHAVVLAAGLGNRLHPLTEHAPKPLLPIDGEPVIGRVLRQLASAGITDATVVIGHRASVLERYLSSTGRSAGASWPTVTLASQPEQLGSAHALQCALEQGMPRVNGVVAASDTWWRDEDVARVLDLFRAETPTAVMGLRRWPVEQLPHRSVVIVDADGVVSAVVEKPDPSTLSAGSGLSGSPLFVLDASCWERVEAVGGAPGEIRELATALQRAIDDGDTILGIEVFDTRDLTRPADLLRHNFPYLADLIPESVTPPA